MDRCFIAVTIFNRMIMIMNSVSQINFSKCDRSNKRKQGRFVLVFGLDSILWRICYPHDHSSSSILLLVWPSFSRLFSLSLSWNLLLGLDIKPWSVGFHIVSSIWHANFHYRDKLFLVQVSQAQWISMFSSKFPLFSDRKAFGFWRECTFSLRRYRDARVENLWVNPSDGLSETILNHLISPTLPSISYGRCAYHYLGTRRGSSQPEHVFRRVRWPWRCVSVFITIRMHLTFCWRWHCCKICRTECA